ncbi:MAG: hypothetical protein M3Q42_11845 [Pseudomonadota bacterium]|nr:hypothetical protein [Pseudomonadota bacterium]
MTMAPMSTKELREKYVKSNAKAAINAAIRAELPGGDEALDVLERLHHRVQETASRDAGFALDQLRLVVAAMEAEIRRRYGMPESL